MKKQLIIFSILVFLCFHGMSQDLFTRSLDGDWEFRKAGTKEWLPAIVPGCIHLDLFRLGIIKDPFYRDNEASIQWISEIGWEYKKVFQFDEDAFSARHIELVCKGLDTYANVYINDSLVIVADNMFREWVKDIKPYLYQGKNAIRIQFPAIGPENKARYEKLRYKFPGDEKVVCRKAGYHFGWDWGPTLITSGIWKTIYLRSWTQVNVLGVQCIQKNLTDSLANMAADFNLVSDLADSAYFKVMMENGRVFKKAAVIRKGNNLVRLDFKIENPQYWWPNGFGKPVLYNLRYEVTFAGKKVGEGMKRVGLRTISLVQRSDSTGKTFYFKVNGHPIFAKGGNYIPQDNFLTRVSDSSYHRVIADVKAANMNMLRVWGGGVYEKDLFYDLCDENGIMVWQDLMFACAMYPTEKDFMRNVLSEVVENVYRLRNHPSIALWCGNNEIDEGWKNWGWQKQYNYSKKDSFDIFSTYLFLFNGKIPEIISKIDTLRAYIPSSPMTGWGRDESLKKGDVHYWGVWWGKEPFQVFNKKIGRFMSEYGFQSFPELSTIKKFTLPDDRKLGSPVLKSHQKHPAGYETIDEYLLRDYHKPKDFESYIQVSQLLQAEGIQTAIEAHRRAKPYCMGTLFWQLNDCWPVVSWSAIDYYGKKKAVYYRIKNAFQQILPSAVVENGRVKVYVISDNPIPVDAKLSLNLTSFDGKSIFQRNIQISIPAQSSKVYFDTLRNELLEGLDSAKVLLVSTIQGDDGSLARNLFYFESPKNLLMTTPTFEKKAEKIENGYRIVLKTDKLAKGVYLSVPLEGEFSDNYFDMLPGESREIFFETDNKIKDILTILSITSLIDTYPRNEK